MSTSAPKNPFAVKPASGSAIPPMTATDPSPFSAFSKKEVPKSTEKSSSNAGYPPMSTSAPTNPFAVKPASGSAIPPMTVTAPSPFGAF